MPFSSCVVLCGDDVARQATPGGFPRSLRLAVAPEGIEIESVVGGECRDDLRADAAACCRGLEFTRRVSPQVTWQAGAAGSKSALRRMLIEQSVEEEVNSRNCGRDATTKPGHKALVL